MQKIRCIIVEDEPLAVKILRDYIDAIPYLECQGIFREAIGASLFLQTTAVDLIFLDIHLPKLKGLAFLRTLAHPPAVIVTTAYHQYAVEGFELNVVDYLLKPFSFERFVAAVNKVPKYLQSTLLLDNESFAKETALFVSIERKKVKIVLDTLLYVESAREYIRIVTTQGEFRAKISTHEMEALLPKAQFVRIHRSFIVAVDKIDVFTKEEVMIQGQAIPIGKAYKQALLL
ncbi:LytR/AlgR family response regulator transcription factor [Runella zeae]|uniref:LytR/AlgR family response regulator transcription factor n=1 Tax=Runella zeae TaxID=94255 RepID=UPI000428EC97|nr:LytTR family DNA-binding domain-containing protein [Runella zeae]